jgi:hypothetical protein
VSGHNVPEQEQLLTKRPSGGLVMRRFYQLRPEVNLVEYIYRVTCVAASVHLTLESDPTYGFTENLPNKSAGLNLIIYDIRPYIVLRQSEKGIYDSGEKKEVNMNGTAV